MRQLERTASNDIDSLMEAAGLAVARRINQLLGGVHRMMQSSLAVKVSETLDDPRRATKLHQDHSLSSCYFASFVDQLPYALGRD